MITYCLDTSAWIEITHDGPNAPKFAKAVEKAETIIVSTISIYEIARYTTRVADENATAEILSCLYQYNPTSITSEIAELAATLGPRHKLAMADALIYATARSHNATLWTQDSDFEGLPHVKYFPQKKS
jgi:predicted nucleic acid-binding protein